MKLSTTTHIWFYRQGGQRRSKLEAVQKCAQAGFDHLDINYSDSIEKGGSELSKDNWMDWTHQMSEELEKCGVLATQAHTPFYNILDRDASELSYKEEMLRRSIISAGTLGVKWIIIHPGSILGEPRRELCKSGNVEYLKPYIELAGSYGMGIALENLFDPFRYSSSHSKQDSIYASDGRLRFSRRYGNWPEELNDLVDTLSEKYSNVGICWDFGHGNEMQVDQAASLELVGSRLKAIHVNDNFGIFDDHLLPFIGSVNWPEAMIALKKNGYDGDLTLETGKSFCGFPDELAEEALRFSARTGRHLIAMFEGAK